MKKITLLLLFITYFSNAQEPFSCGIFEEDDYTNNVVLSEDYDANAKYVLNIYFSFINDTDGFHASNIGQYESYGENEAMEIIKILNVEFNQFNIFFKYQGFRIVNNSDMTNNLVNLSSVPNMYNFYLMNSVGGYSAVSFLGNTRIKMTYDAYERDYAYKVIIHEMGHLLNLHHTFRNAGINNPNNPPEGNCERVTRDINSDDYNADIAGDMIHDTAATNQFDVHNFSDCTYIYDPSITDCIGTPFENIAPANYMSYENTSTCGFHFTPGQVVRMRSHLQNPSVAHVPFTYNTIESLYVPFEITNYPGSVVLSVDDNGDGTAEVCRNIRKKHRFQKGFDYVFYGTFGDDPTDAVVDDLPVVKNSTASFYVQINQVDIDINREVFVDCNKGSICGTENIVKGMIASTPQIGSNSLTIKELNELEVNDPALYETLINQHYHIINKETESGAVKQTVIYKQ